MCKQSEVVLRKTKMCKHHSQRTCAQGRACRFAHSLSELQAQPNLRKTQLCMAFARNGRCRDCEACKYAHGEEELRASAGQQVERTVEHTVTTSERLQAQPNLRKTQLCMAFARNGRCRDCEACKYAHGEKELRAFAGQQVEKTVAVEVDSDIWSRQTSVDAFDLESCGPFNRQTTGSLSLSDDGFSDGSLRALSISDSGCEANDSQISQSAWPEQRAMKDLSSPNNHTLPNTILHKTRLCKFYTKGHCDKGSSCTFAHGRCSLASPPDLFRTRLCFAYSRRGACRDSEACKYAHGIEQRRGLSQDSRQAVTNFTSDESSAGTEVSNVKPANASLTSQANSMTSEPLKSGVERLQSKSVWEVPVATALKHSIKNTFVHVDLPVSTIPLRRSRSDDCLVYIIH